MVLHPRAAQSDFYLLAALLLFSRILLTLLASVLPAKEIVIPALPWVQSALFVLIPVWLQHARGLPLADLVPGRWKDVALGMVFAAPFLLASAPFIEPLAQGTLVLGLSQVSQVVAWMSVSFTLTTMVQRGHGFLGFDSYPAEVVTPKVVTALLGSSTLAALYYAITRLIVGNTPVSAWLLLVLAPVAAWVGWLMAKEAIGTRVLLSRPLWYITATICFFVEVDIFALITDLLRFVAQLIALAPFAFLTLLTLLAWEQRQSVRYTLGAALMISLAGGFTSQGFIMVGPI